MIFTRLTGGYCRSLFSRPPFILQPNAWSKVLPPHFIKAKQMALQRAVEYESQMRHTSNRPASPFDEDARDSQQPHFTNNNVQPYSQEQMVSNEAGYYNPEAIYDSADMSQEHDALRYAVPPPPSPKRQTGDTHLVNAPPSLPLHTNNSHKMERLMADSPRTMEVDEFDDPTVPMDEAIDVLGGRTRGFDPPEDEPPSLRKNDVYLPQTTNALDLDRIDTHYYVNPMPMDEEPRSPVTDDFVSPVSMESYDEQFPSPDIGRPPKKSETDRSKSASPAMRGAQEMLRRNRQRRSQETAKRKVSREGRKETILPETPVDEMYVTGAPAETPKSPESGTTWESGSDATSIGGSSTWTDDNNPDRSSRRALILQMAKARMRNNQQQHVSSEEGPTRAESREMEEEKKNDVGQPYDIDLTGDLD